MLRCAGSFDWPGATIGTMELPLFFSVSAQPLAPLAVVPLVEEAAQER